MGGLEGEVWARAMRLACQLSRSASKLGERERRWTGDETTGRCTCSWRRVQEEEASAATVWLLGLQMLSLAMRRSSWRERVESGCSAQTHKQKLAASKQAARR